MSKNQPSITCMQRKGGRITGSRRRREKRREGGREGGSEGKIVGRKRGGERGQGTNSVAVINSMKVSYNVQDAR